MPTMDHQSKLENVKFESLFSGECAYMSHIFIAISVTYPSEASVMG